MNIEVNFILLIFYNNLVEITFKLIFFRQKNPRVITVINRRNKQIVKGVAVVSLIANGTKEKIMMAKSPSKNIL